MCTGPDPREQFSRESAEEARTLWPPSAGAVLHAKGLLLFFFFLFEQFTKTRSSVLHSILLPLTNFTIL